MNFNRSVLMLIGLMLGLISLSKPYIYNGIVEDADLFSNCVNQPKNTLGFHGLFNLSELHFDTESDPVIISGNSTSIWDIKPTDIIQVSFEMLRYDRGSWQPTTFAISVPNLCPTMYNENQYWYKAWLKYVTNKNKIRRKCLSPGTKFEYEPFFMDIKMETNVGDMNGRFKLVFQLKAFDEFHRIRPTSICFEIKFELDRQ
ncbi:uncharacterized protein LOC135426101 [Drosophila montana]|uniref:uncharacterized protein LOC135426101 n=1 Tax=Drosophila montana TaxID=40370 RepID=UPI00313CBDA9